MTNIPCLCFTISIVKLVLMVSKIKGVRRNQINTWQLMPEVQVTVSSKANTVFTHAFNIHLVNFQSSTCCGGSMLYFWRSGTRNGPMTPALKMTFLSEMGGSFHNPAFRKVQFFIYCRIRLKSCSHEIAKKKKKWNLSCVTFQGNSEIWSHKAGGCLIQV